MCHMYLSITFSIVKLTYSKFFKEQAVHKYHHASPMAPSPIVKSLNQTIGTGVDKLEHPLYN